MSNKCGCDKGHWECKPAVEPANALAIKLMYESNTNTNTFTDLDKTKLESVYAGGSGSGTVGPQGPQGVAGRDGKDGKDGYVGKDGLVGPQGIQGKTGSNGVDGRNGIDGVQGHQGIQGIQGIAGVDGTSWKLAGRDTEANIKAKTGNPGDIWIIHESGNPKDGSALAWNPSLNSGTGGWVSMGQMKGDKGDKGDPGAKGAQGVAGTGVIIKGSDTHANILTKTSTVGDMWIATDSGGTGTTAWKKGDGFVSTGGTGASSWTHVGSIQGPKGDTGIAGTAGARGVKGDTGSAGVAGPIGPQGIQGVVGPKGDAGTNAVTNLGFTSASDQGTLTSSTGTSATIPSATTTNAGLLTAADKTKLASVSAGATKQIPSDWDQADSTQPDFIKNKPSIGKSGTFIDVLDGSIGNMGTLTLTKDVTLTDSMKNGESVTLNVLNGTKHSLSYPAGIKWASCVPKFTTDDSVVQFYKIGTQLYGIFIGENI